MLFDVTSLWQPVIIWLLLLALFIIVEMVTMGLTTIWFAGGALVAVFLALFDVSISVQIIIFLIVSIGLLFAIRPLAVKYFNKERVRTNAESLIGRQAIVISEVDNLQGIGRVVVEGQEWMARTRNAEAKLPVGAVAVVVAISGVKLIIEEREEGK